MKKLNINLSDISGKELNNREKLTFRGGDMPGTGCCQCGCCYTSENNVAMNTNRDANFTGSLYSPCISQADASCAYHTTTNPFYMDWCGINPD